MYCYELLKLNKKIHFNILYSRNISYGFLGILISKIQNSKFILELNGIPTDEWKIYKKFNMKQNLKKRNHGLWVVNILSATTKKKIVPPTVKLIQEGYPVYISSAKVKGKDWMRLRIGFFKDREEANANGKKIMAIINLTDSWSTKVDEKELEEFGGY